MVDVTCLTFMSAVPHSTLSLISHLPFTRAHPSAPNKPPFETLVRLLAAPVDKLKDWSASFPRGRNGSAAKKELKHRDHDATKRRADVE